jgi:nicotinamidase-related amidase
MNFSSEGENNMSKILLIVDVQNDFIDGALGTPEAQAIIPNVKKKIEEYQKRGDLIFFTRDTHLKNYLETNEGKHLPVEHCIKDTDGWQIADGLLPTDNEIIINKNTFGFDDWDYYSSLEEKEIEIVGLCTDICVVSNALVLKAHFPETEIWVDPGCCAGVTPESHAAALKTMAMCQIQMR